MGKDFRRGLLLTAALTLVGCKTAARTFDGWYAQLVQGEGYADFQGQESVIASAERSGASERSQSQAADARRALESTD
jgi:hypothetical protein